MPMDVHAQIYGCLRAAVLSRHFAINNHFRTNFLNSGLVLKSMPQNEADLWRQGVERSGDNPLATTGMLMTCLAVEHYLGRQDALPILRALLNTVGSLYKFDGQGNHFDGYIIRWDPVLRDKFWEPVVNSWEASRHSQAFYLNPDGTYNYCTPLHDPRSRRPMTWSEWNAASEDERQKSWEEFSTWEERYRWWEVSQDELVGLVMGYFMAHWLLKRRLTLNPTSGGGDVVAEIERQAHNLGDYLAEYGYYLVRPAGGFTARGASGTLMALEYPFTRVFERITGKPQGTYNIRHGFQWVMERADVWKSLEKPFNWYSQAGYTLSALTQSPGFVESATQAGVDWLSLSTTSPFTARQLGEIFAIYSHPHVFDVAVVYRKKENGSWEYNDGARREFAMGYALSLLSLRRRFDDWINGLSAGIGAGGWARLFPPFIGLTGLGDTEPNVRTAYFNWFLWFSVFQGADCKSFYEAVAMLLRGDGGYEEQLVNSLDTDQSSSPPYNDYPPTWGGGGEEQLHDAYVGESRAGTTMQRMTAIALAWLHRKFRQENGQAVTTVNFPELPDWDDQNNPWPPAVIPNEVIKGDRKIFRLPKGLGMIQAGKTIETLTCRPDGSAELFLDNPVVPRSPVPPVHLFKSSQQLAAAYTVMVPEWKGDVPTGILLHMGDEFEIEATGSIWAGAWGIGNNGPNGLEDRIEYDHKFPLTGQPNGHPFCLLGKLGEGGAYFFVGEHWPRQLYLGLELRELYLRINDDSPGNGNGYFNCRVRVWQGNRVNWLYTCDYRGNPIDSLEFRPTQEGTTQPDSFFVRHNGARNLTIQSVQIEGGEGAFKLRAKPPYAPPWIVTDQDWQPIELDFSPERLGQFEANVVILSDDPVNPRLSVAVKANVTQPRSPKAVINVSPETLEFGTKLVTSDNQLALTVSNTGTGEGYALELALHDETPPGQFLVPYFLTGTIPPNEARTIAITYRPSVKSLATATGVLRSQVAFNQFVEHVLTLKGEGGLPQIRLEPNLLDFGAVVPLSSCKLNFRIYNDGNLDLTDIDILLGPSEFTYDNVPFPARIQPGSYADIGVTFHAPDAPGQTITTWWDIASNDPQTPRARLTLQGTPAGGRLELVPEFIDFGSPATNMTVPATVFNRGSSPLTVTEMVFEIGEVFAVFTPQLPFVIASGQKQMIAIQYKSTPGVSGLVNDTLYVCSDDPRHPRFPLHLRVVA